MFCNRDDATARRFIWQSQMSDVKRRKGVRSIPLRRAVASSRLQKQAAKLLTE